MLSTEPVDLMKERQKKEPEVVLKERAERFEKAVELKKPDRVPLMIFTCGHVFAKWYRLSDVFFNYDTLREAVVKFVEDFPVDILITAPAAEGFILSLALSEAPDVAPLVRFLSGPMHDVLKDKYTRWPGRELPSNFTFQFLGGEFMKPEEYGKLIEDPVDFVNNVVLPRACEKLGAPGTKQYSATMARLALEGLRFINALGSINASIAKLGMPSLPITFAYAPLDIIGDFLRHPTGAMIDIRRRPSDVKAATERLVEPILKVAFALKPAGAKYAFIPLHLNEMLSPKLYNEFYWPHLRRIIVELYNNGIKSFILFEGDHTPHLETILELPKGWGIGVFERADIRKVKEVLGGHTCIAGGIPTSLLIGGTPEKIEEYVKKLIEDVGKDGGFILAPGVAEVDPSTPEANIRSLINAVLKYGYI
ncbi:MAG: uroporphyrinogen decarboxylase family protein [Desulfurococcaceae archaeon]